LRKNKVLKVGGGLLLGSGARKVKFSRHSNKIAFEAVRRERNDKEGRKDGGSRELFKFRRCEVAVRW
jgi:hypothetical protein